MPFCPNCGTQASGSFCPNCGAPVASSAGGGTGPSYTGGASSTIERSSGLSENVASALCYTPFIIGVICSVIFLVAAPYNRNRIVRFHCFQSLFLHLALFVFWIALQIVVGLVGFVTHGLGFLLVTLYPLLSLAILGLFIYLMIKSFNNQKIKLPTIGDLAEKQG